MRKNTPASAPAAVGVAVAPPVGEAAAWPAPVLPPGRDTGTRGAAPGCGVGGSGGSCGEVGASAEPEPEPEPEPGFDVAFGLGVLVAAPPDVRVGVLVAPPPDVRVGVLVGPPPDVGATWPTSTDTVSEAAVNW